MKAHLLVHSKHQYCSYNDHHSDSKAIVAADKEDIQLYLVCDDDPLAIHLLVENICCCQWGYQSNLQSNLLRLDCDVICSDDDDVSLLWFLQGL
jgi:hypothetical protein